MTRPPLFGRWTSPWYVGVCSGVDDEFTAWLRQYDEESHCGTPGCCESPGVHLGPILTPPAPTSGLTTPEVHP